MPQWKLLASSVHIFVKVIISTVLSQGEIRRALNFKIKNITGGLFSLLTEEKGGALWLVC